MLTTERFAARWEQANLANKTNFDNKLINKLIETLLHIKNNI